MDAMRAIDARLPNHVAARAATRRKHVGRIAAAAAAVAIAAAGLTIALRSSATPAFADVVARVESARTVRATIDSGDEAPITVYASGTRTRIEQRKTVTIFDVKTGEMLTLDPEKRKAARTVLRGQPVPNIVEFLRDMGKRATTPIDGRAIDGVATRGFEGTFEGGLVGAKGPQRVRVFVDPATALPVRIEMLTRDDPPKVADAIDRITFDVPMDKDAFVLTPPTGYTVQEMGGIRSDQLKPPATTQEAAKLVLTPLVGLGDVRFGMTREEVEAVFGKPELSTPNGFSNEYYSRGFGLLIHPTRGVVTITAYSNAMWLDHANVNDFPGKTDRGIGIGSTREEVLTAYGKPSKETGEANSENEAFEYGDLRLTIQFREKRVALLLAAPASLPASRPMTDAATRP